MFNTGGVRQDQGNLKQSIHSFTIAVHKKNKLHSLNGQLTLHVAFIHIIKFALATH